MPFIHTNPTDQAEGHLACDRQGCAATSPTFRLKMGGPLPDGWVLVPHKKPMQGSVSEYFCAEHSEIARRRAGMQRRH